VRPQLDVPKDGLWLGSGASQGDGVYLGTLAESVSGKQPSIWLATGKEQVVAVVGKRGSGKSFTLGVIAEGLSATSRRTISRQEKPRGVLLFDPLDVYWSLRYPVVESANPEAHRHYELAHNAGLIGLECAVSAWVPGTSHKRATDPQWFGALQLSVPEMELEDWELLLDVNVTSAPMGQALSDAIELVSDTGYRLHGRQIAPVADYDLSQLADSVGSDEIGGNYHQETVRALRQRLSALAKTGLFSAQGTTLSNIVRPGLVSVVMLGRLPQSYRTVVVAVLTRMLMRERNRTAFAEKRLALDPQLSPGDRDTLLKAVSNGVSRTVVILDEAQSFLAPGASNSARELFVQLVKEGRNMGLSAVIATQQPSALDQRVLSQVETFISHQLVTTPDIRAVRENLKSELPESIQSGNQQLEVGAFLRQLPPGFCLVSAADMNTLEHRSVVASIRPRISVHGGIEL
jgi:ABC-type thiamine transport system ATPase subunit